MEQPNYLKGWLTWIRALFASTSMFAHALLQTARRHRTTRPSRRTARRPAACPRRTPDPPTEAHISTRFSFNLGNKKHVGSVPGFGFVVFVDAPKLLLVSSHRAECKRVCSLSGNIVIPPCASRAPPTIQCLGQDGGSSNKLLRLSPDVGGPAVLLDARAPPRAWARCTQDPHFDSSLGYTPIPPTPQQDPATRTLEGVSQAFVRPAQCP